MDEMDDTTPDPERDEAPTVKTSTQAPPGQAGPVEAMVPRQSLLPLSLLALAVGSSGRSSPW
jgi:hypothetical protein